jgi:hypothetical protein
MGRHWVTAAGTIRAIADIDPAVAARIFGSRDAIALGGWPGATTGHSWASSARFAEDVANDTILGDLQVAMYDPEHWGATPPVRVDRDLRHARALEGVHRPDHAPPEPRIGPRKPAPAEERRDARVGVPALGHRRGGAANADVIETQAQTLQGDPDRYRALVAETVRIARATKRDIQVLSGLSTHPGYPATVAMLRNAWMSVRDVVDGHYLSLARLRLPEVATAFLAETVTTDP